MTSPDPLHYERGEGPFWEAYYPRGTTVLDVGSYIDTPYWFLKHGARRVIAIDKEQYTFTDPRIHYVRAEIDAIKIDIEGAEKGMIIETHYPNPHLVLLHSWPGDVKLWRLE